MFPRMMTCTTKEAKQTIQAFLLSLFVVFVVVSPSDWEANCGLAPAVPKTDRAADNSSFLNLALSLAPSSIASIASLQVSINLYLRSTEAIYCN